MIDLSPFVGSIERIVARHALGAPGSYRRFTIEGPDETGADRSLDENLDRRPFV